MEKMEIPVRFLTPAFLGDAEQKGAWRSPPFKALLRQWWRVAVAQAYGYNYEKLREAEGLLFGHAWLKSGGNAWASKSQLRIKLNNWDPGSLINNHWPRKEFDQVITSKDGKNKVDAEIYLGFGPIIPPSKKLNIPLKTLKNSPAIGPDVANIMTLIWDSLPDAQKISINDALVLCNWFGTVGSRGRNGWGSLCLTTDVFPSSPKMGHPSLSKVLREWKECMKEEWPHAIGKDKSGPLIWFTEPLQDWKKVIGRLAVIKVDVRRTAKRFRFSGLGQIGGIHLLGYPAGKDWELKEFKSLQTEPRLASQLRFKAVQDGEMLRGMVFHLPACFPDSLFKKLAPPQQKWLKEHELEIWAAVHRTLDTHTMLQKRGGN
ncbi:MAG: hypothetical protein JXB25_08785 [Deltaproteobacteria bacterium]|nr:hypothetical protein [Deltaproteobacteria bacterium]